jgi:hypothetical protein
VIPDRSVDEVFSYITLQHVPSATAVLRYLEDASRVLRQGGQGALQVRRPGVMPGRSTSPATWCMLREAAGCGRQSGAEPASRRVCCCRPRAGPARGSSCDRAGQRHLWVLLWR